MDTQLQELISRLDEHIENYQKHTHTGADNTQQITGQAWNVLAQASLSSAATSITTHVFTPKKVLRIEIYINGKSSSTPENLTFNGDVGNNYFYHVTGDNTSTTSVPLSNTNNSNDIHSIVNVVNLQTNNKQFNYTTSLQSGSIAGSGSVVSGVGVYGNITDQINKVKVASSTTETFAAGSFINVLGHD